MGFPATSGQHDVILPPLLTARDSGGVVGLATEPQQQPHSQMPVKAYANYARGPPQVGFSFRVQPPRIFSYKLMLVIMYAFCFQVPCWMPYSPMGGSNIWGLHHYNPLGLTHSRHMYNLVMVISQHQDCTEWLLPPLLCVRVNLLLLNELSSNHSNYMMVHTALGAWQKVTQSLHLPCMEGRGLLFQIQFHQMTWLTLNLQWALTLVILV